MTPEAEQALTFLASRTSGITSVSLTALREIMEHTSGLMMAQGEMWEIRSRRLCPGVYRLSLTRRKRP